MIPSFRLGSSLTHLIRRTRKPAPHLRRLAYLIKNIMTPILYVEVEICHGSSLRHNVSLEVFTLHRPRAPHLSIERPRSLRVPGPVVNRRQKNTHRGRKRRRVERAPGRRGKPLLGLLTALLHLLSITVIISASQHHSVKGSTIHVRSR
jgi:hypothetical protein